jgi:hypothetical protein
MKKKNAKVVKTRNFDSFEYLMSKELANAYLKNRKTEEERTMNPTAYLVKVVNDEFRLFRKCTKVNLY